MLASLHSQHSLRSAVELKACKPQHNLLGRFRLFLENRLSLATLPPVIMPLPLGTQSLLACLALCHFVESTLATLLTESSADCRNVHRVCESTIGRETGKKALIVTFIHIFYVELPWPLHNYYCHRYKVL